MKTLVLGLGNTILRDDGIGVYVARTLRERLAGAADVGEAEVAGLDLVERLNGYDRAIIVDAIELEDEAPGTVFRMRPDDIRITARLASLHDIDIVTALELGKRLRFKMPEEVLIYAVQVEDARTLREGCTDAVARVVGPLADEIAAEVAGSVLTRVSIGLSERRKRGA